MELCFSSFFIAHYFSFHFYVFWEGNKFKKNVMHLRFTLLNFLFQVPLLEKNIFTRRKTQIEFISNICGAVKVELCFSVAGKVWKLYIYLHPKVYTIVDSQVLHFFHFFFWGLLELLSGGDLHVFLLFLFCGWKTCFCSVTIEVYIYILMTPFQHIFNNFSRVQGDTSVYFETSIEFNFA